MTAEGADRAPGDRPAWIRRLTGVRAEERTYRTLAFGFLPAGLLFGALAAPSAAEQAGAWPAWWSAGAWVLGVGPSLLLGASAFAAPIAVLRRIALAAVSGVLLVEASIPLAVLPGRPLTGQAWFLALCGLGLVAAALALPPAGAVAAQAAGAVLTVVARLATDRGGDALAQGVQDGLYVLLLSVTFLALGVSALGAGRAADREEARAIAGAAAVAADVAHERERERINALVHDRVLATLLSAARGVPGSAAYARSDARRALEGLEALLLDDEPHAGPAAAHDAVWQLQAITTDLAPEAQFTYEVLADRTLPPAVHEALLQAAEEALRNSLRHAGEANRAVHVRIDEAGVSVDVLDDGVGFDVTAVPAGRLGIAESIEGRVRGLDGGTAHVVSRPGVGTRVLLRWSG